MQITHIKYYIYLSWHRYQINCTPNFSSWKWTVQNLYKQ